MAAPRAKSTWERIFMGVFFAGGKRSSENRLESGNRVSWVYFPTDFDHNFRESMGIKCIAPISPKSFARKNLNIFQQQVQNGNQLVSTDRRTCDESENLGEMMPQCDWSNAFYSHWSPEIMVNIGWKINSRDAISWLESVLWRALSPGEKSSHENLLPGGLCAGRSHSVVLQRI